MKGFQANNNISPTTPYLKYFLREGNRIDSVAVNSRGLESIAVNPKEFAANLPSDFVRWIDDDEDIKLIFNDIKKKNKKYRSIDEPFEVSKYE